MKIAVLTSGGHAPGMNAAVRAVAQGAFARDWEVVQVKFGYMGLMKGDMEPVERGKLEGFMQLGGTVLGTERSDEFQTPEGQQRAVDCMEEAGIEGLVVIGGGGSLAGAQNLYELGVKVVGVPATLDNDIWGTDLSVGVDTALNTAVEAIDRIRDTASSRNRAHVVEVLGNDCGYLALMSAIAGGAQVALVPEFEADPDDLLNYIRESYEQGKQHFIVVAAEGAQLSAEEFQGYVNDAEGTYQADLTVLGHLQSGGAPSAFDRILAGQLGAGAVAALEDGESGVMVALQGQQIERLPLKEVTEKQRPLDSEMYELVEILARPAHQDGREVDRA